MTERDLTERDLTERDLTERDLTEREDRVVFFWLAAIVIVFVFLLSSL